MRTDRFLMGKTVLPLLLIVVMALPVFVRASQEGSTSPLTVVLLGEKPRVREGARVTVLTQIAQQTSSILNARVVDMTVEKESAQATANRAAEALAAKPSAVIIFSGFADEAAGIADESVRKDLVAAARTFGKHDIPVFLVPSSTALGAAVSANLRLAAEESAATYVEPGTEIGGKPYEEALAEIAKKLAPAPTVAESSVLAPPVKLASEPPSAQTSGSVQVVKGAAVQTPATIYMVPPPALKSFDPRETPGPKRRIGRPKKPAIEN
ncbi:MAG: hypothetical protein KatS3mg130_0325 [Candidatus Sumerlaea sp.]|nr:hypothetical protein [Candidatus Sumerlaea chitinivorans]GIX43917.1 MAG: hypothetical protein KatS3mg130_0325 [Candidatus Sumerlaea sp.]